MQVSSFRSLSIGDKIIAVPFGTLTVTNQYSRVIGTQPVAHVTVDGLGELSEHDADTIHLPI